MLATRFIPGGEKGVIGLIYIIGGRENIREFLRLNGLFERARKKGFFLVFSSSADNYNQRRLLFPFLFLFWTWFLHARVHASRKRNRRRNTLANLVCGACGIRHFLRILMTLWISLQFFVWSCVSVGWFFPSPSLSAALTSSEIYSAQMQISTSFPFPHVLTQKMGFSLRIFSPPPHHQTLFGGKKREYFFLGSCSDKGIFLVSSSFFFSWLFVPLFAHPILLKRKGEGGEGYKLLYLFLGPWKKEKRKTKKKEWKEERRMSFSARQNNGRGFEEQKAQ